MWNRIKQWWKAEGDWAQLRGLDDLLLADMGLDRDGLRARVMGEAERPGVVSAPLGAAVCEGC